VGIHERAHPDVRAIAGALARHGVPHVVVGGVAAFVHGSPQLPARYTFVAPDVDDVTRSIRRALAELRAGGPQARDAHLDALSQRLASLTPDGHARVDIPPETRTAVPPDGDRWHADTPAGVVAYHGDTFAGVPYGRLRDQAVEATWGGETLTVLGFVDLVRLDRERLPSSQVPCAGRAN
jgi:hypothetical protein